MNEKPASFQLMEPASPEALVPDSWVEPWMIVTGVVVLLVIAAWLVFRKKKPAAADPKAIRDAAYQEALEGLEKIQPLHAREAAVRSSLILRRYLSVAAGDPSLYETHEEFISRHDSLQALTDVARQATGSGFARLASLKYASDIPQASPQEVVADSRDLLETFHHGFQA